ncbi:MAG: dihydrolipoyl dehydrogenase [Candidatus Cloacimonadota bacterium]|nr:MAG: dihydrolipoyl dehydrogenase [Candidatus Cloacimonadota bacterium]
MKDYDIVIIGSGPGGYVAAIKAAQLKKRVCLIEKEWVGGTCLNIGCIPTKALLASAEMYAHTKKAAEFGVEIKGEVSYSLDKIMERKRTIVSRCVKGVEFLLKSNNIDVKRGRGELVSQDEVKVKDETITADSIIIATGSKPKIIKGLEPDGKLVLSSKDALEINEIPENFLVVGAGVIGIEMATFFNSLGVKVTIVEMLDAILPTLESEKLSKALNSLLMKRGIEVQTSTKVSKIEKKENSLSVTFSNGEEREFEKMLVAVGRVASFDGIDIEKIGIEMNSGFIKTDKRMKTNIDKIYAIGDVRGGMLLAHKASREGVVAVLNASGIETDMNYHAVPSCIFSSPPAALVGMTEKVAKERGIKISIGEYQYIGNARAHTIGEKEGYVRIITDENGTVIGGEIVGAQADTMISEIAMACEHRMNVRDVEKVIHPHPTLSEILMEAFDDAGGKAIHKPPRSKENVCETVSGRNGENDKLKGKEWLLRNG